MIVKAPSGRFYSYSSAKGGFKMIVDKKGLPKIKEVKKKTRKIKVVEFS
jgi:hypothetical protein